MATWTKLLPVFLYAWLARRLAERVTLPHGVVWHQPDTDILIRARGR